MMTTAIARIDDQKKGKTFLATSNRNLFVDNTETGRNKFAANELVFQTDAFKTTFASGASDDDSLSDFLEWKSQTESNKIQSEQISVVHGSASDGDTSLTYAETGLVGAIVDAYNRHKCIQLRPDDLWITILCQFSAYVNGRAEELRSKIVDHEGQKELTVQGPGNIFTADFGNFTSAMLDEINKNIKDESLREWFLPGFTTSTTTDDVCAAATAMCAFQKYFKYTFELACGIPQVTLLGTLDDWKRLRAKVDRLLEFDSVEKQGLMVKWVDWLREICDNFIESYLNGSDNNLEFWDCICHHKGGGSGPNYLSGWVTVFSYFDEDGNVASTEQANLGCNGLFDEAAFEAMVQGGEMSKEDAQYCILEYRRSDKIEKHWPIVNTNQLNHNVVSCPVKIDDNGEEYQSRLFVGQMGYEEVQVEAKEAKQLEEGGILEKGHGTLYSVRPRNDWALVVYYKE